MADDMVQVMALRDENKALRDALGERDSHLKGCYMAITALAGVATITTGALVYMSGELRVLGEAIAGRL